MHPDESLRYPAEEALAREITARGPVGMPAYSIVPKELIKDKDKAREFLEKAGVVAWWPCASWARTRRSRRARAPTGAAPATRPSGARATTGRLGRRLRARLPAHRHDRGGRDPDLQPAAGQAGLGRAVRDHQTRRTCRSSSRNWPRRSPTSSRSWGSAAEGRRTGRRLALSLAWLAGPLQAQDLSPRAYLITPRGAHAFTVGDVFNDGNLRFEGTVPITGATGRLNMPNVSYYRS